MKRRPIKHIPLSDAGRFLRIKNLLVCLLLALLPHAASAALFTTSNRHFDILPVGGPGWNPILKVVYSVGPISVPPNSVVDVRLQVELTNDNGVPVGVGRYIVRTTNSTSVSGTTLNAPVFSNLTPEEHHGVFVAAGTERTYAQGLSNVYYSAVIYANANRSGLSLKVEPYGAPLWCATLTDLCYGGLSVETRPAAALPGIPDPVVHEDATLISSLPLDGAPHVLYSYGPVDVPAGSIVDARFQTEISNELGFEVAIGRQIIRATTPTSVTGVPVNEATMAGLSPSAWSAVLIHRGIEAAARPLLGVYYNVIVWASSGYGGGSLVVHPGYGELNLVFSPQPTISGLPSFAIDATENIQRGPVSFTPYCPVVLYSLGPYNIRAGVVVDISFQAEFGNVYGHNIGVGRRVAISDVPDGIDGSSLVQATMSDMRVWDTYIVTHSFSVLSPGWTNKYINAVVWFEPETSGTPTGECSPRGPGVIVEQGYGHLSAQFR